MRALASSVQWVWAFSVAAQLIVLSLLVGKKHFQTLHNFTLFIALNLCQAALLFFLFYGHSSIGRLKIAFALAWSSQAITLLAQALATTEVLRLVLGPYQSIWRLGWRLILATSILDLFLILALYHGDVNWALMMADSGYHFIFATAVIACLLLFRLYLVPISAVYKTLLAGFCFFSCVTIVVDTLLKNLFASGFQQYEALWQIVTISSFAIVQIAWAVALRKPLPVHDQAFGRLPPGTYDRLSPELNLGLRQLDEQLGKFWKVEAPRP